MGVIRSDNPLEWGDVDGIILNENAPASRVAGVAANVAVLVGTAQRGPSVLTEITGINMMHETFGKSKTNGLNKVMKNKTFGRLKFIRVVAANADVASVAFDDGASEDPVSIIEFEARSPGAFGNNLKVKIEAGTVQGKKYTITDLNPDAEIPTEVFDNVLITEAAVKMLKAKLVKASVLSTVSEPANEVATSLVGGTDGVVANTDYEAAIAKAGVTGAGNLLFLDEYNGTRNGYLKTHAAEFRDKMVVVEGSLDDEYDDAITAVANLRDTEGRIIYAFNPAITVVDGDEVEQLAAWWIASAFTQCPAHVDLAYKDNAKYMAGITRLKYQLTPAQFKLLNKAGICSLEFDPDIGHKVKSAVVTQVLNTELVTILRRRMTDFLQDSLAKYLKNYANGVNSKQNRKDCNAGIVLWDDQLIASGVLPGDSEMTDGAKARLIDTESQNDNESVGQGFFKIVYKRRIFSSMRFIVLMAEIGTGVVVVEEAA